METRSYTEAASPTVGDGRLIRGLSVVFGQRSKVIYDKQLGLTFVEEIMPTAITEELLRASDVKAVLEHDKNRMLARYRYGVGTLSLAITAQGLEYQFDAPETSDGEYALQMVRRGDIDGSSFRYACDEKRDVTYRKENGMIIRTVHKIRRLSDISIVSDPAYTDTSVTARSWTEEPDEADKEKENIDSIKKLRKQIYL